MKIFGDFDILTHYWHPKYEIVVFGACICALLVPECFNRGLEMGPQNTK
jgi:hypothetical protein